MPKDWSSQEVKLIVADYFTMLQAELEGRPFNKKKHRTSLLPKLNNRTNASVEFKHHNISAVLAKLGEPYINGYKPRGNYQRLLADHVIRYLELHVDQFQHLYKKLVIHKLPNKNHSSINFSHCLEAPPSRSQASPKKKNFRPTKVNYIERDQNNLKVGAAGEQFVIDYEKWRLRQEGKGKLASLIEWTSREKGDGLGYDILSKNVDGSNRYIEVKTTNFSKKTPIYLTDTEIKFAAQHQAQFYLYRVFNFITDRRLFIYQGSYDNLCQLTPITYRGVF